MLWTADSVEYRSVSMYAAFSGDTLIWIKNTGGTDVHSATVVKNIGDVREHSGGQSGDTIVIGCPGYSTFVTDSLYTQAETGRQNMLWETETKEIRGNYVTDITDLITFEVYSKSSTQQSSRWQLTPRSTQYNMYLENGPQFTQAFGRLFLTSSSLPKIYVKSGDGRIITLGSESEMYCLVAKHNNGSSSGLYEGLEFVYYSGYPDWRPPSGTQLCYFYKIQPYT